MKRRGEGEGVEVSLDGGRNAQGESQEEYPPLVFAVGADETEHVVERRHVFLTAAPVRE